MNEYVSFANVWIQAAYWAWRYFWASRKFGLGYALKQAAAGARSEIEWRAAQAQYRRKAKR